MRSLAELTQHPLIRLGAWLRKVVRPKNKFMKIVWQNSHLSGAKNPYAERFHVPKRPAFVDILQIIASILRAPSAKSSPSTNRPAHILETDLKFCVANPVPQDWRKKSCLFAFRSQGRPPELFRIFFTLTVRPNFVWGPRSLPASHWDHSCSRSGAWKFQLSSKCAECHLRCWVPHFRS